MGDYSGMRGTGEAFYVGHQTTAYSGGQTTDYSGGQIAACPRAVTSQYPWMSKCMILIVTGLSAGILIAFFIY